MRPKISHWFTKKNKKKVGRNFIKKWAVFQSNLVLPCKKKTPHFPAHMCGSSRSIKKIAFAEKTELALQKKLLRKGNGYGPAKTHIIWTTTSKNMWLSIVAKKRTPNALKKRSPLSSTKRPPISPAKRTQHALQLWPTETGVKVGSRAR